MKVIIYKLILTVSFFISVFAYVSGQTVYNFEQINVDLEKGLSEAAVRTIYQDSKGLMWIGTQDGLNRYNGHDIKIYRHNDKNDCTISNSTINKVMEDDAGNLWIATKYGLNKFNPGKNCFKSYFAIDSIRTSLKGNNIYDVFQDSDSTIWVLTSKYLEQYNPENDNFKHYEYYDDYFTSSDGYYFYSITEGPEGNLWFGSKDGLVKFNKSTKQTHHYFHHPDKESGLCSNFVRCLHFIDSKLYIGTDNGLDVLDVESGNIKNYRIDLDYASNKRLNTINTIFSDSGKFLFLGTERGIVKFLLDEKKFKRAFSNYSPSKLDYNVSSIMKDHSGNFWIGTSINGALKLKPNRKKFHLIDQSVYPELTSNSIASVYIDNKERLWIGTWNKGLNIIDRKRKEVTTYSPEDTSNYINDVSIHAIFNDANNRIWVGTSKGVSMFKRKTGKFIPLRELNYYVSNNAFYDSRLYCINQDKRKRIWYGTNSGLYYLNRDSVKQFDFFNKSRKTNNPVYSVLESSNGFLWIGTGFGLFKVNRESLEIVNSFNGTNGTPDLTTKSVLYLHESYRGNIWLGTKSGLLKLNPESNKVTTYTEDKYRLKNDNIYSIVEDHNHNFWLSTNRGLVQFDPEKEEMSNYYKSDGLQDYEFNFGAQYKSENGWLYFGGISGLNYFHPDSIRTNLNKPKVIISSVKMYSKDTVKVNYVYNTDKIVIPNDIYRFKLKFAGLEYTKPQQNKYAYKMEGINDKWIYLSKQNTVSFSQIEPGTYQFRVKAANNDLVWNNEGATIEVVVETPFYFSIYAYVVYVVIGILIIGQLIRYRTRNLRRTNYILKERQKAHEEIRNQKEQLASKAKNIEDSITYARRIIEAMMPSQKKMKSIMPYSFALSIPKDIVSGDFYWIAKKNNKIFLAAVDCTGHGIPGAFMSIIGYDLLRNIITEQGIEEPAEILNQLDKGVTDTLRGAEDIEVSDGMDISFCTINPERKYIEFAGAMNPLYLVRDNNILEFKGDRASIGSKNATNKKYFKNQRIPLQKEDVIYLFSDGFPDQFGGPHGKKFKYRRFRHLLLNIHTLPFDKQKETIYKSIEKWRGELEQVDDILLLGAKPLNE